MEQLHPIKTAANVAHFVMERLTGGGWSDLPHTTEKPVVRPLRLVPPVEVDDIVA